MRIKQLHACDVVFTLFLAEMWEVGYARCGCMRSLPVKVVAEADLGNFSRMKKFLDASGNCKYIFFRISIYEFVEFIKILGVVEEKLFCLLLMLRRINKEEKFAVSVA